MGERWPNLTADGRKSYVRLIDQTAQRGVSTTEEENRAVMLDQTAQRGVSTTEEENRSALPDLSSGPKASIAFVDCAFARNPRHTIALVVVDDDELASFLHGGED